VGSLSTAGDLAHLAGKPGAVVTYHNYSWSGYPLRDVVAEKRGLVDPGEMYLITADVGDLPADEPVPPNLSSEEP